MIITDKLTDQIGKDWIRMLKPFITSEEMDKLFAHIKKRAQVSRIAPLSSELWRAFQLCPPDKVRVILCGISPYHTYTETGSKGVAIADGLMMSCSHTWKTKGLQPSIEQVYNQWDRIYSNGIDPDMIRTGDLSYLAKQGVLLYNIALTVEENKACSMNEAWSSFNKFLWEKVVGQYMKGVCIVLMGAEAHRSAQYINPMQHYLFQIKHPASASYKGEQWDDEGTFKAIDRILMENNGEKIEWYQKKKALPAPWDEPDTSTVKVVRSIDREFNGALSDLPWDK